MFKVRRGGGEEIPLVQGKEQWLSFAGAALKRYPMSKVRETQVLVVQSYLTLCDPMDCRVLQEGIRGQTH